MKPITFAVALLFYSAGLVLLTVAISDRRDAVGMTTTISQAAPPRVSEPLPQTASLQPAPNYDAKFKNIDDGIATAIKAAADAKFSGSHSALSASQVFTVCYSLAEQNASISAKAGIAEAVYGPQFKRATESCATDSESKLTGYLRN